MSASDKPVAMLLHCPMCCKRHVDEGDFETKPHHTHACQYCGHVWRPAVVPTVGVRFLPGFTSSSATSSDDMSSPKYEKELIAEFFTYDGWNKTIEYSDGVPTRVIVVRCRDNARHWVSANTVDWMTQEQMTTIALMLNAVIAKMRTCDAGSCLNHSV